MCLLTPCHFDDYQTIEVKSLDASDPLKKYEDKLVGIKFINDQCPMDGDRWFPAKDTAELKALREKIYKNEQSFFFFLFAPGFKVKKFKVKDVRK
jgi:hypothetical protein